MKEIRKTESKHPDGTFLYEFQCHCGKLFTTLRRSVSNGHTRSCGCLRSKLIAEKMRGGEPPNKLPEIDRSVAYAFFKSKYGARKKNQEFTLSREDIKKVIFKDCFYCGGTPSMTPRRSKDSTPLKMPVNGLDRYDNTKGYTENNIVPCCSQCNYFKGGRSGDEFIYLIHKIAKIHHLPEEIV